MIHVSIPTETKEIKEAEHSVPVLFKESLHILFCNSKLIKAFAVFILPALPMQTLS